MSLEERFWSKVDKSGECWIWTGSLFKSGGYGQISMGRGQNPARAHRLSWEWVHGPIPVGLQVLHKCDVPACVRPEHLFLGTHQDNMKDMASKGRSPSGSKNNQTKLSNGQIIALRRLRGQTTCREAAARYGVSFGYVARVWRGEERSLVAE